MYTILAVDDAKSSLRLLEFDLKTAGYDVVLANSGEQALQLLTTIEVDLILLDMYMPGLTGLETLKQIKPMANFEHLPVIMLSASEKEEQIVAALELGASDYVTKPYTAKILLARIKNALVLMEKTKQLELLANTDSLTQLSNRGHFDSLVKKAINQAKRADQCLSLAMFDLDFFKKVNDNYGHESGDKALVEFANILSSVFRDYDIIGRVGGEEFAVCMPNTILQDAIQACERCRFLVETTPVNVDSNGKEIAISLTVSVGLVTECSSTISYDEMLRHADILLYQAKANGRNQINVNDSRRNNSEGVCMSQVAEVNHQPVETKLELSGIDYQGGVKNVLGDDGLFQEILLMFYEDHGKDGEHIEQALKANDLERLKHLVHTLKGVACSISANTLFEAAKSFDLAINEQRTQQYHELFAELEQQLSNVLAGIKRQLIDK